MNNLPKRRPGNVSFVRFKLGLSQQQLADTLCVSRSMIAMVETKKRKFTGPVAAIYLALCDSAKAANPEGAILVKRGRKPAIANLSVVTNSENPDQSVQSASITVLKYKKRLLSYLHMGLQFKKRSMEERFRRRSDVLLFVTTMHKASTELFNTLPEGYTRDRYELKTALLYAKQVQLKQQLKKCGPVAQVKLEFQTNLLAGQIETMALRLACLSTDNAQDDNKSTSGLLIGYDYALRA